MRTDIPLMFVFAVVVIFCVSVNGRHLIEKTAIDSKGHNKINYRLPNNTKPESYDITISTNIDRNDFNFSGRVVMNLHVLEATHNITIHARQLNIKTIKLISTSGAVINLNPYIYNNITEFLVIPSQIELQTGTQYILTIEYAGVLRAGSFGFYRSSYISANGETRNV